MKSLRTASILLAASLMIAPLALASHEWWHQGGFATTTFTIPASQLALSGDAQYHGICPAPETSALGCVRVRTNGVARAHFNIPNAGNDPEAGADYIDVFGTFGSPPSVFHGWCILKVSVAWWHEHEKFCTGGTSHFVLREDITAWPGPQSVEIRCENPVVGGGCDIRIYEIKVEVGFRKLEMSWTEEESEGPLPGEICIHGTVHSASDWYNTLYVDVHWGDEHEQYELPAWEWTQYDPPGWHRCHTYPPSVVPYVIDVTISDGLGQEQTYHHVHPSSSYDHEATCLQLGSWGTITYQACMAANPDDPICSPVYFVFSGIWWERDCAWATSDPVSWAQAIAADMTG